MPYRTRRTGRKPRPAKPRNNQTLQKPNGVIAPRVQKVGGEHFAIVCVDPAKHRSEWMMADYFGNLLIEPRTLEHRAASFKLVIELIRKAHQDRFVRTGIGGISGSGEATAIMQNQLSNSPWRPGPRGPSMRPQRHAGFVPKMSPSLRAP